MYIIYLDKILIEKKLVRKNSSKGKKKYNIFVYDKLSR